MLRVVFFKYTKDVYTGYIQGTSRHDMVKKTFSVRI